MREGMGFLLGGFLLAAVLVGATLVGQQGEAVEASAGSFGRAEPARRLASAADLAQETRPGEGERDATAERAVALDCCESLLLVLDISDPAYPRQAAPAVPLWRASDALALADGHVFVADFSEGLSVIDVSDPRRPLLVGEQTAARRGRALAISGAHAYLASGYGGLQVLDIRNPREPRLLGRLDLLGPAMRLGIISSRLGVHTTAAVGELLVVATGFGGLRVLDASDPGQPRELSALQIADQSPSVYVQDVVVNGSLAYVAAGYAGLRVVDLTEPTRPVELGRFQPPAATGIPSAYLRAVAVNDRHAYAVDFDRGIHVLDLLDPTSPQAVAFIPTPVAGRTLVLAGDYLYVTLGSCGLQVHDVSDPARPRMAGSFVGPGDVDSLVVEGSYLYLTMMPQMGSGTC